MNKVILSAKAAAIFVAMQHVKWSTRGNKVSKKLITENDRTWFEVECTRTDQVIFTIRLALDEQATLLLRQGGEVKEMSEVRPLNELIESLNVTYNHHRYIRESYAKYVEADRFIPEDETDIRLRDMTNHARGELKETNVYYWKAGVYFGSIITPNNSEGSPLAGEWIMIGADDTRYVKSKYACTEQGEGWVENEHIEGCWQRVPEPVNLDLTFKAEPGEEASEGESEAYIPGEKEIAEQVKERVAEAHASTVYTARDELYQKAARPNLEVYRLSMMAIDLVGAFSKQNIPTVINVLKDDEDYIIGLLDTNMRWTSFILSRVEDKVNVVMLPRSDGPVFPLTFNFSGALLIAQFTLVRANSEQLVNLLQYRRRVSGFQAMQNEMSRIPTQPPMQFNQRPWGEDVLQRPATMDLPEGIQPGLYNRPEVSKRRMRQTTEPVIARGTKIHIADLINILQSLSSVTYRNVHERHAACWAKFLELNNINYTNHPELSRAVHCQGLLGANVVYFLNTWMGVEVMGNVPPFIVLD